MGDIARRIYILVSCAISLQGVTWAVIALLRGLLIPSVDSSREAIAFQIAVVVIGLPVFLFHWLWAQRLVREEPEEQEAVLRRLYLYGTMAGLLFPLIRNGYDLLTILPRQLLDVQRSRWQARYGLSPWENAVFDLITIAILGLLWFYHRRIVGRDTEETPETGASVTVRGLYTFALSGTGLTMTVIAVVELLRWIMSALGAGTVISRDVTFTLELPRLVLGLALWIIFWLQAQRLFREGGEEERRSILRKLYLYLVVFAAILGIVISGTFIVRHLFQRLLQLGGGDLRTQIAVIISMMAVGAYHALVLRHDQEVTPEVPGQALVRQISFYLVAAIGFGTLIEGLGGLTSVLIQLLAGESFGGGLKEQLAWFAAVLIAGLAVWIPLWRRILMETAPGAPDAIEERRSIVRRIYLYFYLLVATVTVLASAVYVVYRLLSLLLGVPFEGNLAIHLGQPIAFSLIAAGIWLYHGSLLRQDQRLLQEEEARGVADFPVAVVDVGEGHFGRAVLEQLRRALPNLPLLPIGLTPQAAGAMGTTVDQAEAVERVSAARLIIGPWIVAVAGGAGGVVDPAFARAVVESAAGKLLAPLEMAGWDWVGAEAEKPEAIAGQAGQIVRRRVTGKEAVSIRRLSAIERVAVIVGVVVLLIFLAFPVLFFFNEIAWR